MLKKPIDILIVDDSEDMVWSMSNILENAGFLVDAATNGKDAMEFMRRHPKTPLIILDYLLPDMSGLSLLAHIKQNGSNPKVVVVTGFRSDEVYKKFFQEGACAFFEKPFKIKELVAACKQAMEKNTVMKP